MKPDVKPSLSTQETVAALCFACNNFVSKPERRAALIEVMRNLAALPDYEVLEDGRIIVLYEYPRGSVQIQTINPSLE